MKTQYHLNSFIAALLFCTISNLSFASHNAGGNLTYTHLAGNQYMIHGTLYRDCWGIPAPTQITVYIESASCSQSQSLQLTPIPGTGQEVTQVCPTANSRCTGGIEPGYEKWEYEGVVTLPA